ncbi:MAG: hypothetical protein RLZZ210_329 [Pseudomonadota bacterium]|jgi:hypothetical protein
MLSVAIKTIGGIVSAEVIAPAIEKKIKQSVQQGANPSHLEPIKLPIFTIGSSEAVSNAIKLSTLSNSHNLSYIQSLTSK